MLWLNFSSFSSDICAKRGVTSYSTNHTNCRVYWKCNEKGLDDPYCCPKGKRYDPIKGSCVLADTAACREQPCPTGFTDVQGNVCQVCFTCI